MRRARRCTTVVLEVEDDGSTNAYAQVLC